LSGSRARGRASAIGLVLSALLVVSGCAGSGGEPEAVRFWSFAGIGQAAQVDAFLESNPRARIELSEIGTSVETANALSAALAAGAAPDLVLIQGDDMPRFLASPGLFTDLRDLGADALADDYLAWAWQGGVAPSGEVIGIPTDVGGLSLAYRADLFESAGLPTDPTEVAALWPTWDAFIETGERFTARTQIPFIDNIGTTIFANATNQLEEKYYSPDGDTVYAENPGVREAFDLALRAHRTGISAGMPAFSNGWSTGMSRDAYAVMPAPSWMLRVIEGTAPELAGNWRIAAAPGVAGNWGGSYLAIPAGARDAGQAWRYIAHSQSPDRQLDYFLAGGPLPAALQPYESEHLSTFADDYFGASDIGAVLTESLRAMTPVPRGPDSSVINEGFLQTLAAVEEGSVGPPSAWRSALDAIDVARG
jgi:cellobiose transport system substrate-binding protein